MGKATARVNVVRQERDDRAKICKAMEVVATHLMSDEGAKKGRGATAESWAIYETAIKSMTANGTRDKTSTTSRHGKELTGTPRTNMED